MDNRSVVFVEIMIAIAIVGVAAFLIYLISHNARKRVTVVGEDQGLSYSPRWYEFVLATIVLLVAAGFILWQVIFSDGFASLSAELAADAQSLAFFVIMMTVGGIAILAFIIFSLRQQIRGPQPVEAVASVSVAPSQTPSADTPDSSQETPLAIRLLGLALFGLAFLLLNWIYVERSLQHQLMLFVIYPASFAVALVLLLDKASRKWSIKSGAASVREWLICDALVFLLLLGFLNLAQANASKKLCSAVLGFPAHRTVFLHLLDGGPNGKPIPVPRRLWLFYRTAHPVAGAAADKLPIPRIAGRT